MIDTNLLIVGAGAAGMAFADSLIAEADANVVTVDRRHRPGGHWNDAYPFARLHQTSAHYGEPQMQAALARYVANSEPAIEKLESFLAQTE